MNSRIEKKGYEILKEAKAADPKELDRIFKEAETQESTFSELVVLENLIKENQMLKLYAKNLGLEYVELRKMTVDKDVLSKVPIKFAEYYKFFPFKYEDKKLHIAVSRLLDVDVLDEIRLGLGIDVEIAFALKSHVEEMLKFHYGLGADTVNRILKQSSKMAVQDTSMTSVHEVEDIEKLADNASVVQLVNQIILDAFKKGASDIHLEPLRGRVRVRYRVDGVLHEAPVPKEMNRFYMSILSRIKIMANLNIVERRLPQDGKARVKTSDQNLDLRISSIPTPHGESMVIRILPAKMIRRIEDLGMDYTLLNSYQKLLSKPHGIIFVTGPTGSGKSTTLYAGLSTINTVERKVITIEDPVEYELDGTTQIQVQSDIGLTFSRGLRSVLRHDPDVMMVGEVRDLETADIAIRVALTGHLILSTLHTNDAASGVTRLLDIGVEPYLVSSSVEAFMAQRLVRVICPECKVEDKKTLEQVKDMIRTELNLGINEEVKIYKGMGCDECNGTGSSGRIAIYELLPVNEEIRKLIFARASAEEIKNKARQLGMKTLRQDGLQKVLLGLTTPDEIMRVTPSDTPMAQEQIQTVVERPEFYPAPVESKMTINDLMPKEQMAINRRAYVRVPLKLKVNYHILNCGDQGGKFHETLKAVHEKTFSEDISANGVAFTTEKQLSPGFTLDLKISLPGNNGEIQCVGKVVRVTRSMEKVVDEGGKYINTIGVTFLAINSEDRMKLEKIIHNEELAIEKRNTSKNDKQAGQ